VKHLRLHWDAEIGWVVDVPFCLPEATISRVVAISLPKQLDRLRSLPPGDRKAELARAIKLLQAGKVEQRLVDANGDGVYEMYKTFERTSRKVISYG
jgi:hypothetical protein